GRLHLLRTRAALQLRHLQRAVADRTGPCAVAAARLPGLLDRAKPQDELQGRLSATRLPARWPVDRGLRLSLRCTLATRVCIGPEPCHISPCKIGWQPQPP